ncbi:PREDICTED: alkaline phosphatase 4 [Bactrocera latifrons]|uniref:alkaline phosphatase 4 n=1 Tax=Bactrocera latifrons TaxID=174628 RepID=UPI0008DC73DC|nr:PREDICTED: alkaline phosphatase 4 [Bactrocera latifrons]
MESDTKTEPTKVSPLRLNTVRIFSLASALLLSMIVTVTCISFLMSYEVATEVSSIEDIPYWKDKLPPEQQLWYDEAIEELQLALKRDLHKQLAENAIIFVTSGIDTETMAAARALLANRTKPQPALSWERFPHLGRLKNSCSNTDLCDPFTVASAIFNGVRSNFRVGGLDSGVLFRDCAAASNVSHHVKSLVEQAQEVGLRTGFVTTRRVTGASMAALYARTPNTAWECDAALPLAASAAGCIDVAQQLIKSACGRNVNVIMGGGRQTLVSNVPNTVWDPVDETTCNSQDKRNIISDWQLLNVKLKRDFAVLLNSDDLRELNGTKVDYVMGIFANNNLQHTNEVDARRRRVPQLSAMITKSLNVLKRKNKRYLLVVESGVESTASVDKQMGTLLQLNDVVQQTLDKTSGSETLVLVLFTNGNYVRNAVESSAETDATANVIDFGNNENTPIEQSLSNMATEAVVYAKGPRSYLLHGVHEETYMSYVLSYALQMGHFKPNSDAEQRHR